MPRRAGDQGVELDEIDKRIISELQVDGRVSFAQLAPIVGLSQAATRQRVNRLIDRGVMQVVAVTDPQMIGLGVQALVGVRVNADARAVAEALSAIDEASYVVLVTGRFEVMIEVVCASTQDLLDLVNERIRPIPGIASLEIFPYQRLVKQTYSWGTG
jgi:Lrp/AsnC family transcriptional regulator for asnA, asnC and gidA